MKKRFELLQNIMMKFGLVSLFAFLVVVNARILPDQIDLEVNTAYNYLEKIGLPLAEKIRRAEEDGSRIVGGSPAINGRFPYQAGLIIQFGIGQSVCGASLISSNRLLTAAHCWFDGINQASSLIVVLGSNTLFFGGTRLTTNQVVMHPGWNPNLIRDDVATIKINNVAFSNTISPIALPSGSQLNEDFAGETAVASGFGLTSDGGSISSNQVLSYVQLPVITNAECSVSYPFFIQSSNICTSGADGKSTCSSDSGGPLAVQRNGRPLLIGVTSFGSGFGCSLGFPAAFARVTSFMDFVNQNL